MADDDRGPPRRPGRAIRGSRRESSEPLYTAGSPSTPGRRHATRDFILRSPQYPALRDHGDASASTSYGAGTETLEERRMSEAEERAMLLEELEQVEESVEMLRRRRDTAMSERERQADIERVVGEAYRDSLAVKESQGYESLEAMLKDMDDTALSALLTNGAEDNAVQALLQHLPAEPSMTLKAPARSAGIEGTGSAFQIDEDENRLAEANGGDLEELLEDALRGRLRRNGELTLALDEFCGFAIDSIASYRLQSRDATRRPLRHITIRGSFVADLGLLVVDMDVEDGSGSKDDTPRIRTLDLEVDDPIYFAIGAERLTGFVESVNLPAILLAVRTLLPLTIDRFRLLREIALRYPDLSRSQVENWLAKGIDVGQRLQEDVEIPPITQLVNPEVMRTLRLGKEEGGPALLIHFTIAFSQWGCATPQLSVDPVVEDRDLHPDAKKMLKQLPERFAHLCAHNPSNAQFRVALIATIDAFFGLS